MNKWSKLVLGAVVAGMVSSAAIKAEEGQSGDTGSTEKKEKSKCAGPGGCGEGKCGGKAKKKMKGNKCAGMKNKCSGMKKETEAKSEETK